MGDMSIVEYGHLECTCRAPAFSGAVKPGLYNTTGLVIRDLHTGAFGRAQVRASRRARAASRQLCTQVARR
jgi:hypothetical protein